MDALPSSHFHPTIIHHFAPAAPFCGHSSSELISRKEWQKSARKEFSHEQTEWNHWRTFKHTMGPIQSHQQSALS
jgi:hypothetical protein